MPQEGLETSERFAGSAAELDGVFEQLLKGVWGLLELAPELLGALVTDAWQQLEGAREAELVSGVEDKAQDREDIFDMGLLKEAQA